MNTKVKLDRNKVPITDISFSRWANLTDPTELLIVKKLDHGDNAVLFVLCILMSLLTVRKCVGGLGVAFNVIQPCLPETLALIMNTNLSNTVIWARGSWKNLVLCHAAIRCSFDQTILKIRWLIRQFYTYIPNTYQTLIYTFMVIFARCIN